MNYDSEKLRIEKSCFCDIRLTAGRGERIVDIVRKSGKNLDHKLLSVIEDLESQIQGLRQEIQSRQKPGGEE
jgi:hypothetical protein